MAYIDEQLLNFKNMYEKAIRESGASGIQSTIRSSHLINLIHEVVKYELLNHGVDENQIYPHYGDSKNEIKLAGYLKQKKQDVCVVPKGIEKKPSIIDWGPLAYQGKFDSYGFDYSNNTLAINVRSQMSSLSKNYDTLFERTFAEALNLHMRYPDMVLGEVYLIPIKEYDDAEVSNRHVAFKKNIVDVEKYISFFNSINGRKLNGEPYLYERCALLIVDFSQNIPVLFRNSDELKAANIISRDFQIEYSTLCFDTFVDDILEIYNQRYDINNLLK